MPFRTVVDFHYCQRARSGHWLVSGCKANSRARSVCISPSKIDRPPGPSIRVAISLAINPHWPVEWRSQLSHRSPGNYGIPLLLGGGPILLLALLRWRNPAARLLLVMACVPQSILFYDQLPLWLIPRSRLQSAAMGLLSLVGLLLGNAALPEHPTTEGCFFNLLADDTSHLLPPGARHDHARSEH